MPSLQGDPTAEFTASDILAPQTWQPQAPRPALGIDIACTKVAVDFQNLTAANADPVIRQNLEILRESTATDVVFLALFDGAGERIDSIAAARSVITECRPEALRGESLDSLPWVRSRLEHIRLVEFRDTTATRSEQLEDAQRLSGMGIRSLLLIAFAVQGRVRGFLALASSQPRPAWDVNLHLLLKLVGTSLASGLERMALADRLASSQEREQLSLPCANDGIWDYDAVGNRTWFSPRWKAMLGYAEDDDIPSPDWTRMVHPDDLSRVSLAMREHLAGKTPMFESMHRLKHVDGNWRWVVGRAIARTDSRGALRRMIGVELDVTERKLYEDALFREKERAQITLQSIGDGVITSDAHGRIEYLNPVAEELTGWRLEDSLGCSIDEIFRSFHEETCEPLENPMTVAIRRARAVKSVRPVLLIRRDGNELYVEHTASPIRDGQGAITGVVLVFHDVSEARELNRRLSYHTSHDVLTGLVNRRELETRLERALQSAKARETSYALCYIDLDQFKIINDTCGHAAGDALLGQVGTLLKSKVRWRDTLARLGGDEFGVLLESCPLEEALRTAESLREAISRFRFTYEDRSFRLGASVGVVPITADNEDVASILSAADSACGAAKENGRNRVHCFEENDLDLMRRRREMQWAARINNALEESRFDLYRMRILPLTGDEEGEHYELLLRMRDETGKIVSPDQFIVAAERYGITPSIDRWVVNNLFRWLVSEADERERLALVAVNLSGQSLGDEKFLPFVIDHFHRSGVDPGKVCFEITETAAIANFSQAKRFIQALRDLGCKFALDDFGTGLSSFSYLRQFPVDYLKIDGSFVRGMVNDTIDREMVRSINEIGHLTGKKTIAEFAENDDIIQMLRAMGVDYAQGYGVEAPHQLVHTPIF